MQGSRARSTRAAATRSKAACGVGIAAGAGLLSLSGRGERGDGFIPITAETRGPADQPRLTATGMAARAGSRRSGRRAELQASVRLPRLAQSRDRLQRRSHQRRGRVARLVGRGAWQWSALGYWQWRNLRSGTASVERRAHDCDAGTAAGFVPSHGLGGSFEVRPPLPQGIELRVGARARRTTGETRSCPIMSRCSRRGGASGRRDMDQRAFAEASAQLEEATLTGGGTARPLADQRRPSD